MVELTSLLEGERCMVPTGMDEAEGTNEPRGGSAMSEAGGKR